MSANVTLKTFVGYQIKSEYHNSDDIKSMGEKLNNILRQKCIASTPITLDLDYGEFRVGTNIWEEIHKRIEASQVTVFDISENNPNVLLEAGISLGLGTHVILLKCKNAEAKFPVPSNLRSLVFIPYEKPSELTSDKFAQEIATSIIQHIANPTDAYLFYRLLWSLDPKSRTIIIPSILPNSTFNKFEDYIHFRTYGDIDSLVLVMETLHRIYPKMYLSINNARSLKDLPTDWDQSNIIFIGGPDFNPLVKELGDYCQIGYKYGAPGENKVWLYDKRTRKEYTPEFYTDGGEQRARDYGFFVKTNGRAPNRTFVFLGGARTWGVYGATKLVSCTGVEKNAENYAKAKQLVTQFGNNPSLLLLIEVIGSKNGISYLHQVACRSLKRENWTRL